MGTTFAAWLARYIREAEDPWNLDLRLIEEKLAAGKFTAYDIDALPCRNVDVNTGTGEWFMESPFAAVTSVTGAGTLSLAGVSLGMHGLFSTDGRFLIMDVHRTETAVLQIR